MRGSIFRGENPERRDVKQSHTHSITVVPIPFTLGGDPQEQGNNLRNGDLVGTAEMADGWRKREAFCKAKQRRNASGILESRDRLQYILRDGNNRYASEIKPDWTSSKAALTHRDQNNCKVPELYHQVQGVRFHLYGSNNCSSSGTSNVSTCQYLPLSG